MFKRGAFRWPGSSKGQKSWFTKLVTFTVAASPSPASVLGSLIASWSPFLPGVLVFVWGSLPIFVIGIQHCKLGLFSSVCYEGYKAKVKCQQGWPPLKAEREQEVQAFTGPVFAFLPFTCVPVPTFPICVWISTPSDQGPS